MTAPAYATVEQLAAALDVDPSANATSRMRRAVLTASRRIDNTLHRHFYPLTETRTYHTTPTSGTSGGGRRFDTYSGGLWLAADLLSLTSATEDGDSADTSTVTFRPDQAPYFWAELSGDVIAITGVWGFSNDTETAGTLDGAISDTTGTTFKVSDASKVGIGDLLTIDSERFIVEDRAFVDTTANVDANLTANKNDESVSVDDGSLLNVGETIKVESERMLITDITSNTLTVVRAVDGTTLAAHSQPIDVYAPRTLTVERGAVGTTAATHSDAATITRNVPPHPIVTLCIAEASVILAQETSAYARTIGSGDAAMEARGVGLAAAWKDVEEHYRRRRMAAL